MRLGILGGTFDPIHFGHLRIAEEASEDFRLEKVLLVPGAVPPHKVKKKVSLFEDRFAMTRIASEESPYFEALDIEGRREGFSYSVDTLEEIHGVYGPGLEPFFIIGIDAFLEIRSWKRYESLFSLTNFIVINRPGFDNNVLGPLIDSLGMGFRQGEGYSFTNHSDPYCIFYREFTLLDISSTRVRELTSTGKSIRFLVPEGVRDYIETKGLYLNGSS